MADINPASPVDLPPVDELQAVIDFIRKNGTNLAVGVAALLVIVLGFSVYRSRQASSLQRASQVFDGARTPKDLQTLIEEYPSSPLVPLAQLRLAKLYFDSSSYDQAIGQYEGFLREHPGHPFEEAAHIGRAHCMEARGLTQEALAGFAAAAQPGTNRFMRAQAVFGQGRCLEQLGRLDEARIVYEDYLAAHPDTAWASKAEDLLESVRKRLAAVNAKAMEPATPDTPSETPSPPPGA